MSHYIADYLILVGKLYLYVQESGLWISFLIDENFQLKMKAALNYKFWGLVYKYIKYENTRNVKTLCDLEY